MSDGGADGLHGRGARVLSVFGPFNSRVLVEMPEGLAAEVFPDGLVACSRSGVVEAVEGDLDAVRKRDADLADSALAASALALAYELENPYNSATSKSMCAKALMDAMATLRELAPPQEKKGELHDIKSGRAIRLAAGGPGS